MFFPMVPRRHQIQKDNIRYRLTLSLSLLFLDYNIFSISLCTIFILSSTKSEVRRERPAVGEILVAGMHTITIAMSGVLPYEAVRYYDLLEYRPLQRSKTKWAVREWCSQNFFANRNQKVCRKQPFLVFLKPPNLWYHEMDLNKSSPQIPPSKSSHNGKTTFWPVDLIGFHGVFLIMRISQNEALFLKLQPELL